jgi:hypothetical protein
MIRKKAEVELGKMFRSMGYFAHKWRDRGYISCPTCMRMIRTCPHCNGDLLLEKAQERADFLVAYTWSDIECKADDTYWPFGDFSTTQISVLGSSPDPWVFLMIGDGHAPKGRHAFLIPWHWLLGFVSNCEHRGVRFSRTERSKAPIASEIFGEFQLVWEKGGWIIPLHHTWRLKHGSNANTPETSAS